jgi:hypothetical protein
VNLLQQIIDLIPNILGNVKNKLQLFALGLLIASGTYITTVILDNDKPATRQLSSDQSKNAAYIERLRKNLEAQAIVIYKKDDKGLEPIYTTEGYEAKDILAFFEPELFEAIALGNCILKDSLVFNPKADKKLTAIICPVGRKGAIAAAYETLPPNRNGLDSGSDLDPTAGILWNFGEKLLEEYR